MKKSIIVRSSSRSRLLQKMPFSLADFFYKPYRGHDGPHQTVYSYSSKNNPLLYRRQLHLHRTYRALVAVRARRSRRELEQGNEYIYNRLWFMRMCHNLEPAILRVEMERVRTMGEVTLGSAECKTYMTWFALLEVICSLILYAEDPRYHKLTDSDVEDLRFPLSKTSRATITRLDLSNGHLTVNAHF